GSAAQRHSSVSEGSDLGSVSPGDLRQRHLDRLSKYVVPHLGRDRHVASDHGAYRVSAFQEISAQPAAVYLDHYFYDVFPRRPHPDVSLDERYRLDRFAVGVRAGAAVPDQYLLVVDPPQLLYANSGGAGGVDEDGRGTR